MALLDQKPAQGNTDAAAAESKPSGKAGEPPEPAQGGVKPAGDAKGKEQATEGAEGTPGTPKAKAPEKYEFTAPEGVLLDPDMLKQADPLFKKLDLDQAQAQALIDLSIEQQKRIVQNFQAQRAKQAEDWENEFRNDTGFGGANLDASIADAHRALKKFDEPALLKAMSENEWGNHPALLRLLAKVGKAIKEDNAAGISGRPGTGAPGEFDSMYPTMAKARR